MLTAVFDAYRVRSKFYYSVSREKSTFCYYSRITIRVTPVKHYSLELEFPILVSFGKKFSR